MATRTAGHLLKDAILAANGTVGGTSVQTHVPQPLSRPFSSAEPVEHESIRSINVGDARESPAGTGFLDGIQRYSVVGRFDLVPIVRGYVAAAVLGRQNGSLTVQRCATEEFIAVSLDRLSSAQLDALAATGLSMYDSGGGDREHPVLDIHLAARVVEARRENAELEVTRSHLDSSPRGWVVVDGAVAPYVRLEGSSRVLGLVKSHETQFLDGADLRSPLAVTRPGPMTST